MHKKTLILGATPNLSRYAYIAASMLSQYGHPFVPVGIKKGEVFGQKILSKAEAEAMLKPRDIHTITLYVNPLRQQEWYDFLLNLQPQRIIFNPGTENPALAERAQAQGIETVEACTLVMLRTGQY
ncbi:CoA-binding protein [Thermonema rossianum]|uniref:CoA-binding protein n=1 Tax=Thermonema rossianum TaxID=55505 RepID=UPI0005713885|nr:CoA-binding protein [Thermonema rossianum]